MEIERNLRDFWEVSFCGFFLGFGFFVVFLG